MIVMTIGIILLSLMISGCGSTKTLPGLSEVQPNCTEWTICTDYDGSRLFNVSGQTCISLKSGEAQKLFNMMIEYDVPMGEIICES